VEFELKLFTDPDCTPPEKVSEAELKQVDEQLMTKMPGGLQERTRYRIRRSGSIIVVIQGVDYESVKRHLTKAAFDANPISLDLPAGWGANEVRLVSASPGPVHWLDVAVAEVDAHELLEEVHAVASATFNIEETVKDKIKLLSTVTLAAQAHATSNYKVHARSKVPKMSSDNTTANIPQSLPELDQFGQFGQFDQFDRF